MKKLIIFLIGVFMFAQINAAFAGQHKSFSPAQELQSFIESLKALDYNDTTAKNLNRIKTTENDLSDFFDLNELGRITLKNRWEKATPAQRTKFVFLMQRLIEKIAYPSSSDFFKKYKPVLLPAKIADNKAEISVTINVDDDEETVAFKFVKKQEKWAVYDVIIDDESLADNFRMQFNKILQKKDFNGLLKLMEVKLNGK